VLHDDEGAPGFAARLDAIAFICNCIYNHATASPVKLDAIASINAGYVERLSCDADGRGQIVRITPEGKALQRKMWPVYRSVLEREFASRLSEVEAERLAELLHRPAGASGPTAAPSTRAAGRGQ
jgi:hypothetical protein